MPVDATMHLDNKETYSLRHFRKGTSSEFWILRVKQEDGSEMTFHSHDAFDTFTKEISRLWAEGGEEIE